MKKNLWILILIGLLFRLFISVGDYRGDVSNHIAWGKDLAHYGFSGFYERNFPARYGTANPNYPPLANYAFFASQILYESAKSAVFWLNTNIGLFPSNLIFVFDNPRLLPAFYKIWAIFADVGIAYLIFLFASKIIKEKNSVSPLLLAALALFNPAFFYNSAWWGQVDSVPLFFVLASLYWLFHTKRQLLPIVIFIVALLFKQTVIIFLPIFLVAYFKKHRGKRVIKNLAVGVGLFILSFIPFYPNFSVIFKAFTTYLSKILIVSGLPYITNHAFNFWWILFGERKVPSSAYYLTAYLITGVLVAAIVYRLRKRKIYNKS